MLSGFPVNWGHRRSLRRVTRLSTFWPGGSDPGWHCLRSIPTLPQRRVRRRRHRSPNHRRGCSYRRRSDRTLSTRDSRPTGSIRTLAAEPSVSPQRSPRGPRTLSLVTSRYSSGRQTTARAQRSASGCQVRRRDDDLVLAELPSCVISDHHSGTPQEIDWQPLDSFGSVALAPSGRLGKEPDRRGSPVHHRQVSSSTQVLARFVSHHGPDEPTTFRAEWAEADRAPRCYASPRSVHIRADKVIRHSNRRERSQSGDSPGSDLGIRGTQWGWQDNHHSDAARLDRSHRRLRPSPRSRSRPAPTLPPQSWGNDRESGVLPEHRRVRKISASSLVLVGFPR